MTGVTLFCISSLKKFVLTPISSAFPPDGRAGSINVDTLLYFDGVVSETAVNDQFLKNTYSGTKLGNYTVDPTSIQVKCLFAISLSSIVFGDGRGGGN